MNAASENGHSAVANPGMIALYAVIGTLAVVLFILVVVACIRKEIRRRKRETVNMDMLEVSNRFGAPLNRQRSISLIDINSHLELRKTQGSDFGSAHSVNSLDPIPRFLPLSCEVPRQQIVNLDVESKQNRTSTSIQGYMKSVGLVKDQIDVFDETEDEVEDSPKKGLKYKKTRPRSRSTDSHNKSLQVHSISLSDSEEDKKKRKGKSKLKEEDSDTDAQSTISKASKVSKSSRMSRTSKKSATTRHKVESDSEDDSTDSERKAKKSKHDNNNDNAVTRSPKKKKKQRRPSSRNLLQASASSGSTDA